MSQKDYIMEIVQSLLKSNNHIRGLAKELKTNQTTISRKIKELERKNVVDYRKEGKNSVYALKKSLEAQQYVIIGEHYHLLWLVEQYPFLKHIVQKIRANPKVGMAVIFGSYAKGLAHKDSDIDIFIETMSPALKKEIGQIDSRISAQIGAYDKNNLLIKEIQKNHVIIKGVEHYYEKNEFFHQT